MNPKTLEALGLQVFKRVESANSSQPWYNYYIQNLHKCDHLNKSLPSDIIIKLCLQKSENTHAMNKEKNHVSFNQTISQENKSLIN